MSDMAQRWIFGETTITKTGGAASTNWGSGSKSVVKVKLGNAIAFLSGSGTKQSTFTLIKSGNARSSLVGSGSKSVVKVKLGNVIASLLGSGNTEKLVSKSGNATLNLVGSVAKSILKIKSGTGILTNLGSGTKFLFIPPTYNPFALVTSFRDNFVIEEAIGFFKNNLSTDPVIFVINFDMENPNYTKTIDLTCIVGDTLGVFTFEINPVSKGAIVPFDFTGVQTQAGILKEDGTIFDDSLSLTSSTVGGKFVVELSQDAAVTETYTKGTYPWYLKLIFIDGLERTFYRGQMTIS